MLRKVLGHTLTRIAGIVVIVVASMTLTPRPAYAGECFCYSYYNGWTCKWRCEYCFFGNIPCGCGELYECSEDIILE